MMLLIAHLISLHSDWKNSHIRLLTLIDDEEGKEKAENNINSLLKEARLKKEAVVLTKKDGKSNFELIREYSEQTDLTILGLGVPEEGQEAAYAMRIQDLIRSLGSALLVRSVETEELL